MNPPPTTRPSEKAIAELAYRIWEYEDRPAGRALDDWLHAELWLRGSPASETRTAAQLPEAHEEGEPVHAGSAGHRPGQPRAAPRQRYQRRSGHRPPGSDSSTGSASASPITQPKPSSGPIKSRLDEDPSQGIDPGKQALVTIDAGSPTSGVSALPATEFAPSFTINWAGQDDAGGSGVASFNVYVSIDGGPFVPWLANTTQTSAQFTGQNGHTYAFYSAATDNVGNVQADPRRSAGHHEDRACHWRSER